jgi:hypothetical protein
MKLLRHGTQAQEKSRLFAGGMAGAGQRLSRPLTA